MNLTINTDGMPIHYIDDELSFNSLCKQWMSCDALAIDTEFVRTNTFYAKIGLLQIADLENCYLIDPLEIGDWNAFSNLLANSSCTFVIHSCSEDLNLLQTFLGVLPAKTFDTQLAAAFLGLGFSVSYQSLVAELIGIDVAKDETRSDWTKRPLTESQLHYAATDVRYLLELHSLLHNQLDQKGMLQWFFSECEQQTKVAIESEIEKNWEAYYANFGNAWRLNDWGVEILQKLCYWREQKARARNKPRSWIVKDNDLLNLAEILSKSNELSLELFKSAEEVDSRFLSRYSGELLGVLTDAKEDLQPINRELLNKPLGSQFRKKLKHCQKVVNLKAEGLEMAPEILGRKKQLLEFLRNFQATGQVQWSGELAGWRRGILESEFTAIMSDEKQNE